MKKPDVVYDLILTLDLLYIYAPNVAHERHVQSSYSGLRWLS
jgi:hypothetical protein